jgi:hypothetical protein
VSAAVGCGAACGNGAIKDPEANAVGTEVVSELMVEGERGVSEAFSGCAIHPAGEEAASAAGCGVDWTGGLLEDSRADAPFAQEVRCADPADASANYRYLRHYMEIGDEAFPQY